MVCAPSAMRVCPKCLRRSSRSRSGTKRDATEANFDFHNPALVNAPRLAATEIIDGREHAIATHCSAEFAFPIRQIHVPDDYGLIVRRIIVGMVSAPHRIADLLAHLAPPYCAAASATILLSATQS